MKSYIRVGDSCPIPVHILEKLARSGPGYEKSFRDSIQIVKEDRFSYSGICSPDGLEVPVFLKCYQPRNFFNKTLVSFGLTRPFKLYSLTRSIEENFPVPYPFALVTNRRSKNTYYFSRHLQGVDLARFLVSDELGNKRKEDVMVLVGWRLAEFHELGWMHGDFKWTNIFIGDGAQFGMDSVNFIDLDSVRSLSRPRSSRGRDLARFMVNAEDNGADMELLDKFLESYSHCMAESSVTSQSLARPYLRKLRKRHSVKYG
jgi:tRNA A-37 threonylcarbamoyl transferase component Bud32